MKYEGWFRDVRFLIEGFVDGKYLTDKGAIEWCRENKDKITPEFMKNVYKEPDGFFYYESHLRQDDEDDWASLDLEKILLV